jgi:hypothetical protein
MVRKRAVVVLGAAAIVIAVAVALVPSINRTRLQTTDFVHFYAAASIVLHGHGARLYDRETQDAAFQSILGYRTNQYFLHPPFQAGAIAPFALLSFEHAFVLWTLIHVALIGLLPLIVMPCVPLLARKPYLGLLAFCFPPMLIAFVLGQDAPLLPVVIGTSYLLMCRKKDVAAGLVLSIVAIKFQYLAILLPLLLFSRKFRLLAGCALGCICLAAVSALVIGPSQIPTYFRFVHDFEIHSGYGSANPTLMVNLRGFLTGIGHSAYWQIFTLLGALLILVLGLASSRFARTPRKQGLAFALYITSSLLAAPYAHFADMTMLLLAMLLATDYVAALPNPGVSGKLIYLSGLSLFLGPVALMLLGGHYWWNSRIYLMFPLITLFWIALALELWQPAPDEFLPKTVPARTG